MRLNLARLFITEVKNVTNNLWLFLLRINKSLNKNI